MNNDCFMVEIRLNSGRTESIRDLKCVLGSMWQRQLGRIKGVAEDTIRNDRIAQNCCLSENSQRAMRLRRKCPSFEFEQSESKTRIAAWPHDSVMLKRTKFALTTAMDRPEPSASRLAAVDVLRGIAIVVMALDHTREPVFRYL